MTTSAKCALFLLLGLIVGGGGTAAVFTTTVIPKFNKTLDDDQKAMAMQADALRASGPLLTQTISELGECNAKLIQRNEQVQNQSALILKNMNQPVPVGGISTLYTATAGTVIFEPTPTQVDVHLSIGMLRGLSLKNLPSFKVGPAGQMAPHWFIPGKVIPMFAGDSRGAFFYFLENDQLVGPMAPQAVPQQ